MLINLFESFVKGQFYDKDIIFGINFTKRMELCNAIDINYNGFDWKYSIETSHQSRQIKFKFKT